MLFIIFIELIVDFILIEILNLNLNMILFIYLLISFLVKIPIYLFHG